MTNFQDQFCAYAADEKIFWVKIRKIEEKT